MRVLGNISNAEWETYRKKARLTLKVVFYDTYGNFSLYRRNKTNKPNKANLAGGGFRDAECTCFYAADALQRELSDEVGLCVRSLQLAQAPILSEGFVPTRRDGYDFKHLFVMGLRLRSCSLGRLVPIDGELEGPHVFSTVSEARGWANQQYKTRPEALDLYFCAVRRGFANPSLLVDI